MAIQRETVKSTRGGDDEFTRTHPYLVCTGAYFVGGKAVVCPRPECQREQRRRELKSAREDLPRLGLMRYAEVIQAGSVQDRPALRVARAWAQLSDRPFLILLGPVGSGKTLAGILALCVACYDLGYLSAARLHAVSRSLLDEYAKKSGFLLDDLGLEHLGNEMTALHLFDLVNTRYLGNRRTVVTSNLTRGAFQKRYDDRILRRLMEAGFWYDGYEADGKEMS